MKLSSYKRNKKSQQLINLVIAVIALIGIFISFFFMINYLSLYYTGAHNADLGQNMRYLESQISNSCDSDFSLTDLGNDGAVRDGSDLYPLGLSQQKEALDLIILFSCVFGICFGALVFLVTYIGGKIK